MSARGLLSVVYGMLVDGAESPEKVDEMLGVRTDEVPLTREQRHLMIVAEGGEVA